MNKKRKVGFLGPPGTFTHQAAQKAFSEKKEFVPFETIKDIFRATDNKETNLGIVPIENSNIGIVSETVNGLIKSSLKVTASFNLKIEQNLLARTDDISKLKIIKTKKEAFFQCQNWIQKNLPKVKLETTSSTVAPITESNSEKIGFIGSKIAGEHYNLNILKRNIEDKDNFTKFYLISHFIDEDIRKEKELDKTLILLSIHDRVGALRDILDVFAENNINLTSLHSIPSHLKAWDYFFFLEIDYPYSSDKPDEILKKLKNYCSTVKVIGVSQ